MRNGHIPAEGLMNYFDRLLSNSESDETNFKLHVCDENNFKLVKPAPARYRFKTNFVTSEGTVFAYSAKLESVIFRESTAHPGKTVTLEKLLTKSWCKNKYKRQIHLSKTIKNVRHDQRRHVRVSHDNKGPQFLVCPSR